MLLNHIVKGTPIDIMVEDDQDSMLKGRFFENKNNRMFLIHSQEIFDDIDSYAGKSISVSVVVRDKLCSFESTVLGKGRKIGIYYTVMLEADSEITEKPLRSAVRLDIKTLVDIYEYSDKKSRSYKGLQVCNALSADINKNGIRLLSDYRFTEPEGTMFTLEFSLTRLKSFTLPAKIVGKQKQNTSTAYAYAYGFSFDFTQLPEMREQLTDEIFKAKLAGARIIKI
ncbi:MAG: hypothetical protein FWH14_06095 [Oscillospiraceae bacterium]|nr:hypothetical protein [Oscillospiraceae bacterium]